MPFEFDEIESFSEGKAKAKKDGKWGYIDPKGAIIMPFKFDSIKGQSENKVIVQLDKDNSNSWGVVNLEGEIIQECNFFYIGYFNQGKAKAAKNYKKGFLHCNEDKLYWVLENGFYEGSTVAQKNNKWGLINEQIVELLPFEFDEMIERSSRRVVRLISPHKKLEPNITNPNKIKRIFLVKKGSKWGSIDIERNELIPFEFDEIGDFREGRAFAKKNGKYGLLDAEGNTIIPFEYNKIELFNEYSLNRYIVQKSNKWGYIDLEEMVQDIILYKKKSELLWYLKYYLHIEQRMN